MTNMIMIHRPIIFKLRLPFLKSLFALQDAGGWRSRLTSTCEEKKMVTRILLVAFIAGSSLFAADGVSPSNDSPRPTISAAAAENRNLCANDAAERNTGSSPNESKGGDELFAQVLWASACYSYAGPVCRLASPLLVGSPCTCYYPNGALSGIAQ